LIAASMEPTAAPNASKDAPSVNIVGAIDRKGRNTASPTELTRIMGLLPNRAVIKPVRRMAPIDPSPEHNSRRPRTWSSTPTRTLAKGTSGAQQPSPKPATKKETRVAWRVLGRSAVNEGAAVGRRLIAGSS
jgi:hypothetical protein